jgi:hypothetical protein
MSTALESWLKRATCGLSAASTAQVRREIQEHYESACEEAFSDGAGAEEADRAAVASLGDARTANRQYRKVLLTASEARLLRETRWEARAVCSRLRWLFLIPAAVLCAGIWFFVAGQTTLGLTLLVGATGLGFLFASPFLPIYTRARGRVVRVARWAWVAAILVLAVWPDIRNLSWLLATCAWPLAWVEWKFFSLRRKLPVTEWPKQLYL